MRTVSLASAMLAATLALVSSRAVAQSSLDRKIASGFDSDRGLRAEEIVQRALASSPDLRSRAESRLAASASVDQARLDFLPKLSGSGRYTRLSAIEQRPPFNFDVPLNQFQSQAQLSVPVSDYLLRLTQKFAAARHAEAAAIHQERAARAVVATNARIAYYDWARARLQVIVAEQGLAQAKEHLLDATNGLAAGSASRADVLRAESRVAQNELLLERANSARARQDERLRTVVHDPDFALGEVGEDVRIDPAPIGTEGGVAGLFAEALQKRHEIRALERTALSLSEQASAAGALRFPRLDAVADATYANPNQRFFPQREEWHATWSAGVVLSWSLNDVLSASPTRRNLEARSRDTVAQKQALADQLRSEVVDGFQALRETTVSLATAKRGLTAAEESHRVRRALFQAGRATSTELTDAETDLLRAQLELVNAYIDARLARVRLQHATGREA